MKFAWFTVLVFAVFSAVAREDAAVNEDTRLLLLEKDARPRNGAIQKKNPDWKLVVEEVRLDAPVKGSRAFPIPELSMRNHVFYRDGQPVFLLGMEEAEMTIYPFLAKLMGTDFFQFHGTRLERIMGHTFRNNTLSIHWQRPLEEEMLAEESLRNGVPVYLNPCENLVTRYFKYFPWIADRFPELYSTFGHFYAYRHDHPDAWKIRSNYWKQLMKYLGKYPIFAYELFNEVRFMDYSPEKVARFREAMKRKYGKIERANRIWKTSFSGFGTVAPNWNQTVDSSFEQLGRSVSRMLWNEWLLFTEKENSDAFSMLRNLVKRHQPDSLITIQSYCGYPFDYGGSTVNPRLKSRSEDFYGDESHFPMPGFEVDSEAWIVRDASVMFWLDYLATLNPSKPQMSLETGIRGSLPELSSLPHVVDLKGKWRFMPDNGDNGFQNGFHTFGYDDSRWKTINVPSKWADCGFPDTTIGWYRKHFALTPEQLKKKVYFNARRMADFAVVYLNGTRVVETSGWDDTVDREVTPHLRPGRNVIAIRLKNTYLNAGVYWGGLRDSLSLDRVPAFTMNQLQPGQVRTWMWHRAIHGENGVVPSYFYAPEGNSLSLFRQSKIHPAALADFPKAKYEIESVAELMLIPKPRITGKAALIYPLESLRYHVHRTYSRILAGPLTAQLREWYASLLFSGIQLRVIDMECDFSDYKILFMRHNKMISRENLKRVRDFVARGGVLVRDSESMVLDLDTAQPLGAGELLTDGAFGKGFVYTVRDRLNHARRVQAFREPLRRAGVSAPLKVAAEEPLPYLETHLLTGKDRCLIYLLNWGVGGKKLNVRTVESLPRGRWNVRDIETGKTLGTCSEKELMDKGITISAHPKLAKTLLLESTQVRPLTIRRLSEEQKSWFERIANPGKEAESKRKRILFASQTWAATPVKMLTACTVMKEAGYSWSSALEPVKDGKVKCWHEGEIKELPLSHFGIIMLLGPFNSSVSREQGKILADWTSAGGSLFIAGNTHRAAYGWTKNTNIQKTFYFHFDIVFEDYKRFLNEKNNLWGFQEMPIFTGIGKSPVAEGVQTVYTLGSPLMRLNSPAWTPVITGGKDSNYPNQPLIAVRNFGRGKIAASGDANWLKPDLLRRGDNRKLWKNILDWLSK